MTPMGSLHRAYRAHFVLIPFMAQGHTIPMVNFGCLLAERGILVTLITTPVNAERLQPSIDHAKRSDLPIRFVPLPFACEEVGLPPGCENIDVISHGNMGRLFVNSLWLLERPLRLYLQDRPPLPTCLVSDFCHAWTRNVARDLKLPRYVFYSVCCFTLTCQCILPRFYESESIPDDSKQFVIPGLEHHQIEIAKAQATGFFPDEAVKRLRMEVEESDATADGIVVNTFAEMEPMYVESYAKAVGRKVWPVGPVSLHNKQVADRASRGARSAVSEDEVLSWLGSMAPKSVVYFCLGSLTRIRAKQMQEIGLGLEASGSPFIWVTRGRPPEVDTWLAEGFEERNRGRSLVIRGWAPQVLILSHPSVGGFVTHCGWNSSMEGIAVGVPMVTWPFFADQFLNERLLVDVVETGVSVGMKEPNMWWREDEVGVVRSEELAAAVRRVMGAGEEAEERRRRALELGKRAEGAMREGGSSDSNVTALVEEVVRRFHGER